MSIEIFSDDKYKKLRNSYYFPIFFQNDKWNTTNNYVYSKLLCYPTYQTIVKNTREPIKQYNLLKNDCNQDTYIKAINTFLNYKISNMFDEKHKYKKFVTELLKSEDKKIIYMSNNKYLGYLDNGQNLIGKLYEKIRYQMKMKMKMKNDEEKEEKRESNIIEIWEIINKINDLVEQNKNILNLKNMSFNELKSFLDSKIKSKEVNFPLINMKKDIIKMYNSQSLTDYKIVEESLNNKDNIINIYLKFNIRKIKEKLLKRKRNNIFLLYLKDRIYKQDPNLDKDEIDTVIQEFYDGNSNQELYKLKNKVNKYMLDGTIVLSEIFQSELDNLNYKIDEIIPTDDEILNIENLELDKKIEIVEEEKNVPNLEIVEEEYEENSKKEWFDKLKEEIGEPNENEKNEIPDNIFKININDFLSPIYEEMVVIDSNIFPTLSHYIFYCFIRNYISILNPIQFITYNNTKIRLNINQIAHNYIYIDKKFININDNTYMNILKDLECECIKKLYEDFSIEKFKISKFQKLLFLTGNKPIIYNDPNDACLGIGENGEGQNNAGKIIMKIRLEYYKRSLKNVKRYNLIKYASKYEKDPIFLSWIHNKIKDVCNSIVVFLLYKPELIEDSQFTYDLIVNLYKPCVDIVSEMNTVIPLTFSDLFYKFLFEKIEEYGVIIKYKKINYESVWKYISSLIFTIIKLSKKENNKPSTILNKMQYELRNKNVDIKNCLFNLLNITEDVVGGFSIDENIVQTIGSIIYSKKYTIKDKSLSVNKNITKSDLTKFNMFGNINLLNILYNDIENNIEKDNIKNRVNFFCFKQLSENKFKGIDIEALFDSIDDENYGNNIEISEEEQISDADEGEQISEEDEEEISDEDEDEEYGDEEL